MRLTMKAVVFAAPLLLTIGLASCTPPTHGSAWTPPQCWGPPATSPAPSLLYSGPQNALNNAAYAGPGCDRLAKVPASTIVRAPGQATADGLCNGLFEGTSGAINLISDGYPHAPRDGWLCL
jgi:hypothetical protein